MGRAIRLILTYMNLFYFLTRNPNNNNIFNLRKIYLFYNFKLELEFALEFATTHIISINNNTRSIVKVKEVEMKNI